MGVPSPVPIGTPFIDFPGGSFNALVSGHNARRGQKQPSAQHNFLLAGPGPWLVVKIKNSSGADREPGHVLGISGALIPYESNTRQVYSRPMFDGIIPTSAHQTKYAICIEQIRNGKVGSGVIMGAVWAQVDITDVDHGFAAIKTSEPSYLESSSTTGAIIIEREKAAESGSAQLGVQWAAIIIGGGGGGNATIDLRKARVVNGPITAATSNLLANWGTGDVHLTDDITGELIAVDVEVVNQYDVEWPEDAMITVNVGYTPARVENGTCAEFVLWE